MCVRRPGFHLQQKTKTIRLSGAATSTCANGGTGNPSIPSSEHKQTFPQESLSSALGTHATPPDAQPMRRQRMPKKARGLPTQTMQVFEVSPKENRKVPQTHSNQALGHAVMSTGHASLEMEILIISVNTCRKSHPWWGSRTGILPRWCHPVYDLHEHSGLESLVPSPADPGHSDPHVPRAG